MAIDALPKEMAAESRRSKRWNMLAGASGFALWGATVLLLPFIVWAAQEPGFSLGVVHHLFGFVAVLFERPLEPILALLLPGNTDRTGVSFPTALGLIIGLLLVWGAVVYYVVRLNPHRSAVMIHGDAAWASPTDLERMDSGNQVGPSGKYLHFGYGPDGRRLALIETLSILCLAPPGTGKTTRLIVPGLLMTDDSSFVVHDPKPELWDLCSGWCAKRGLAFRLDWSAMDSDDEKFPERSEWNPSFNFLDPRVLPPRGPDRDTYLTAIANVLVPSPTGGGSNDYFVLRGQAALIGFLQWIISTVTDRMDDPECNPWLECSLPAKWHGLPASFPMMVDWINFSQQTLSSQRAPNDQQAQADPLRPWLESLVQLAVEREYAPRCVTELQPLVNMAPQERSGILGTMEKGLQPFKLESVAERTATLDFAPADLRGRLKPSALAELGLKQYPAIREDWDAIRPRLRDDMWEPVTVMICIDQSKTAAFELLTAVFFQVLSLELLSFGPNATNTRGAIYGPYPCCFLMDEFAKLAKCDAVLDGPDLGRSKKTYYVLVAQDIKQIERRYSAQQKDIIIGTTAVKLVLPQNSPPTIKEISEMVGKVTIKRHSTSRNTGLKADPFAGNVSASTEGVPFLHSGNLSQMPDGTHILIVQGWLNRPVRCKSAVSFLDPDVRVRCYNDRPGVPDDQRGPKPALSLPAAWRAQRLQVLTDRLARRAEEDAAIAAEARFLAKRYHLDPARLPDTPGSCP